MPVYKEKSDPLVCGSYRAIKLLEQPIKVLERERVGNAVWLHAWQGNH